MATHLRDERGIVKNRAGHVPRDLFELVMDGGLNAPE